MTASDRGFGGKHVTTLQIAEIWAQKHRVVLGAERRSEFARHARQRGFELVEVETYEECPDARGGLADELRDRAIDVVLTTGRRDGVALSQILAEMASDATFLFLRNSGFPLGQDQKYLTLLQAAERIFVVSERQIELQFRELIAAGKLSRNRFVALGTYVDLVKFRPRSADPLLASELSLSPRAKVVGCVARLSWEKGQRFLLEALPAVLRAEPDTVVLLAGAGDDEACLREQVARLGLEEHVIFAGGRDDVPELLALCTLHVLPTICEETGAISNKEAMAMGVPALSTTCGVIPEYICHGENGWLVRPESSDELAEAITMLLRDAALRGRLAEAGRREIEARHDLISHARGILHVLDDIEELRGRRDTGPSMEDAGLRPRSLGQ